MYLNLYMAKATDSRCRVISCVYMGVDGLLLYVLNNAILVTPLSMATHAVIFSTLRERTRGRDCRDDPRFAKFPDEGRRTCVQQEPLAAPRNRPRISSVQLDQNS